MSKKQERLMKRYTLPEYCDCREVVMRELEARDDIQAAIWADAHVNSALKDSPIAAIQADRREAIRNAIVEVDGTPVNLHGVPYMEMERWAQKTMVFIEAFFSDLNGAPQEDVKNALAAGTILNPASEEGSGNPPIAESSAS